MRVLTRKLYRGHWAPLAGTIRALSSNGLSPFEIAKFLRGDCRVDRSITPEMVVYIQRRCRIVVIPTAHATDAEHREARWAHAFILRCRGVTYREIGKRLGVSGAQARNLAARGDRQNRYTWNRWRRWEDRHTSSRPIDMGGARDRWLVFTPESNHAEMFGKDRG